MTSHRSSQRASPAYLRLGRFTSLSEAIGHYVENTMVNPHMQTPAPSGCRYADCFILANAPPISLPKYCKRLAEYMRLDEETLIIGLALLRKIIGGGCPRVSGHRHSTGAMCPAEVVHITLTKFNVHRLLLVAFILAVKSHCDEYFPMSWYSVVGGVPQQELIDMEMGFLVIINFEPFVGDHAYTLERMRLVSDPCFEEPVPDSPPLQAAPAPPPSIAASGSSRDSAPASPTPRSSAANTAGADSAASPLSPFLMPTPRAAAGGDQRSGGGPHVGPFASHMFHAHQASSAAQSRPTSARCAVTASAHAASLYGSQHAVGLSSSPSLSDLPSRSNSTRSSVQAASGGLVRFASGAAVHVHHHQSVALSAPSSASQYAAAAPPILPSNLISMEELAVDYPPAAPPAVGVSVWHHQ